METYSTYIYVERKYIVNKIEKFGGIYNDNCEGLAHWYYANINQNASNLIINIHGNWHQTYPNPYHLTVEYDNEGESTGKLHMSIDHNGYFHKQNIRGASKKRKPRKKKNNNKSKRKK